MAVTQIPLIKCEKINSQTDLYLLALKVQAIQAYRDHAVW